MKYPVARNGDRMESQASQVSCSLASATFFLSGNKIFDASSATALTIWLYYYP